MTIGGHLMHVAGRRALLIALAIGMAGSLTPASAQVLGVFRWQMQPYCNVVTFTVIQQGPTYQLTGNDDLCGAQAFAPATGTATPNPNGTISLGFDIVLPSGSPAHVSANISLSNVSGAWTDADGQTGAFIFNPPAIGGPPRPAPTRSAVITSAQLAASIFAGTGSATTIARSDHTHDDRYFTEAETSVLIAAAGATAVESSGSVPALTPAPVSQRIITTPKAGRLLINMPVGVRDVQCTSATQYYIFLSLDGVSIANSIVLSDENSPVPTLTGVTTAVIPAGTHAIGATIQCQTGGWTIATVHGGGRASAVVLP